MKGRRIDALSYIVVRTIIVEDNFKDNWPLSVKI